jgi:hypothetical protein
MLWIIGTASARDVEELKRQGWDIRAAPPEVLAALRGADDRCRPGGARPAAPGQAGRGVVVCLAEGSVLDILSRRGEERAALPAIGGATGDRFDARTRERLATLVEALEEHGDEEFLDDLIHESCDLLASDVNGEGYQAQVEFLVDRAGIDAVEQQVQEWLRDGGGRVESCREG